MLLVLLLLPIRALHQPLVSTRSSFQLLSLLQVDSNLSKVLFNLTSLHMWLLSLDRLIDPQMSLVQSRRARHALAIAHLAIR